MAVRPPAVEKSLTNMKEKIATLGRATDGGTVLLAAQTISNDLALLLQSKMTGLNSDLKSKLFKGYGPMSSFSARTDVCYALGLIDKRLYKDIDYLREIRNKFAHTSAALHLETPSIVEMVQKWKGLQDGNGRVQFFHKSLEISRRVRQLLPVPTATKTHPN